MPINAFIDLFLKNGVDMPMSMDPKNCWLNQKSADKKTLVLEFLPVQLRGKNGILWHTMPRDIQSCLRAADICEANKILKQDEKLASFFPFFLQRLQYLDSSSNSNNWVKYQGWCWCRGWQSPLGHVVISVGGSVQRCKRYLYTMHNILTESRNTLRCQQLRRFKTLCTKQRKFSWNTDFVRSVLGSRQHCYR